MPIEFSKEFMDHAEWSAINRATQSNQDERNKQRVEVLKAEYSDLKSKGIEDKSLLGDINKQERFIKGYGGIAKFAGLDADVKPVDYAKVSIKLSKGFKEHLGIKEEVAMPADDKLATMSHSELLALRTQYKGNMEKNIKIAPFEHRAYAREAVQEHPALAPLFAGLLIPGYQAAKLTGVDLSVTEDPTTPSSMEQLKQGYMGVHEGLVNKAIEIISEKKAP
jgi:hypothetical protein